MKTSLLLIGALLLAGPIASGAIWTVEWDDPGPGYGTLEYTVQQKQADDTWIDKATTQSTSIAFVDTPAAGTEFRLKIRNVNTGEEALDPNIVVPVPPDLPPPSDLNFRLKTAANDYGVEMTWQPLPSTFDYSRALGFG